jgi:hypothetical protein
MNLGENRIEMRIPRSAWFLAIYVSRLPKPFLIEFITASKPFHSPVRLWGVALWGVASVILPVFLSLYYR